MQISIKKITTLSIMSVTFVMLNNCSNKNALDKMYTKNDHSSIVRYCFSKIDRFDQEGASEFIKKDMIPFLESKNNEKLYDILENSLINEIKTNDGYVLNKYEILVKEITRNRRLIDDDRFVEVVVGNYLYSELYSKNHLNSINRNKAIKNILIQLERPIKSIDCIKTHNLLKKCQFNEKSDLIDLEELNKAIILAVDRKRDFLTKMATAEESLKELTKKLNEIKSIPIPQSFYLTGIVIDNINLNLGGPICRLTLAVGNNQIVVTCDEEKFANSKYGDYVSMWVEKVEAPGMPNPKFYLGSSTKKQRDSTTINSIKADISSREKEITNLKAIPYDSEIELACNNLKFAYEALKKKYLATN